MLAGPNRFRAVRRLVAGLCVAGLAAGAPLAGATGPAAASVAAATLTTRPASTPVHARSIADPVLAFGSAARLRSLDGTHLNAPIVAMAPTATGQGYWLGAADGGVFSFGDATFAGSMGGQHLNRPIVAMAAAPAGGYWLVASDGGVFAFGGAPFAGSTGNLRLNAPIVGMAVAPGGGYWLVASDGGVFTFGGAPFAGSMGGQHLNRPVVAMATAPGGGYWLVASDGGIFNFGGAPFAGSTGNLRLNAQIVAMAAAPSGGYWLFAADGGVFTFGRAPFAGSGGGTVLNAPVVAAAASPVGAGYWLAEGNRSVDPFTPQLVQWLDGRTGTVTAAAQDLTTGDLFVYHPGVAVLTASIVKVQIMGTLLAEAQAAHRPLTAQERALEAASIDVSDNAATSAIFAEVGGAPTVQAFGESIGMTGTAVSPAWGSTTSTAADQEAVLRAFTLPNRILSDESRAFGLSLLAQVEPSQAFGVNEGLPTGVLRAIKTGRLPNLGVSTSIGWIDGAGRNYLVSVLIAGGPSDAYSEATEAAVGQAAFAALGP